MKSKTQIDIDTIESMGLTTFTVSCIFLVATLLKFITPDHCVAFIIGMFISYFVLIFIYMSVGISLDDISINQIVRPIKHYSMNIRKDTIIDYSIDEKEYVAQLLKLFLNNKIIILNKDTFKYNSNNIYRNGKQISNIDFEKDIVYHYRTKPCKKNVSISQSEVVHQSLEELYDSIITEVSNVRNKDKELELELLKFKLEQKGKL